MLRAMVGIGLLCALMIVLTYEGTLPRVTMLKAEALEKAIFKVLPGAETKQTFVIRDDKIVPMTDEKDVGRKIYAGYDKEGQLVGLAIEASGMGYADVIRILYGYDPEKEQIIGFHVLESKETPGLGDKIEKEDTFLANFDALDVALTENDNDVKNAIMTVKSGEKENPWEIDGITGATISSRAIGDMLRESTKELLPLVTANMDVFTDARPVTENVE